MVQTLDLEQQTANYINDGLNLPVELTIGQPTVHGISIVYVMRPLQKYTNYLDGRQKRTFAFDIEVKHPSWDGAIRLPTTNICLSSTLKVQVLSDNLCTGLKSVQILNRFGKISINE